MSKKIDQNQLTLLKQTLHERDFEISELKQRAERLQNLFSTIITYIPGHVYWQDDKGNLLGCNQRQAIALGYSSPEAVIGKHPSELVPESEADQLMQVFNQIIATGESATLEESITFQQQKNNFLSFKVPLKNDKGKTTRVLGLSIDITDRVRAEINKSKEEKLKAEAGSRAKSAFIANMSHDVRTPLTGILAMTQALLNTARDAGLVLSKDLGNGLNLELKNAMDGLVNGVKEQGSVLMGSAGQLLNVFNEILDLTQLEQGILDKKPESFDLKELFQNNVELFMPVAKNKALDFTLEWDSRLPPYVKGLREYVNRTVLNLTSNALKFTKTGHVKLCVRCADSAEKDGNKALTGKFPASDKTGDAVKVMFSIEDTGIGIPEDKFDTIFDYFSRLTPSYEGNYPGSGLGLYTVKQYLKTMGGEITLESTLGRGSCFTITLPLLVSETVDNPKLAIKPLATGSPWIIGEPELSTIVLKPSLQQSKRSTAGVQRILVVEDSKPAAMGLSLILDSFDCEVDFAANGAEALDKAIKIDYALILMDIGLPDFSGIEVTKKIRELPDLKKASVPIIAVTGHANDEKSRQDCLEAGMQDILIKPTQTALLEPFLKRYVFA